MAWKASPYALKLLKKVEGRKAVAGLENEKRARMPYKASEKSVRSPMPQNPATPLCNAIKPVARHPRPAIKGIIAEKAAFEAFYDRISEKFAGRTSLTLAEVEEYLRVSNHHLCRLIEFKELKRVNRPLKFSESRISLDSLIEFQLLRMNVMKCKESPASDRPLILAGQNVGQEPYLVGFAKKHEGKDSVTVKQLAHHYGVATDFIHIQIRNGKITLLNSSRKVTDNSPLEMSSVLKFIREKFTGEDQP
ncbi:hypothetical protein QQ056_17545 [Oscillatoria laete-virens NRMC-F 0139]|nr:hypothetical protein [Oscillatoria laete-virens]MDL5055339.1 hypothetical protein [Oscillatoria laete-virens NRMC-F 0139]